MGWCCAVCRAAAAPWATAAVGQQRQQKGHQQQRGEQQQQQAMLGVERRITVSGGSRTTCLRAAGVSACECARIYGDWFGSHFKKFHGVGSIDHQLGIQWSLVWSCNFSSGWNIILKLSHSAWRSVPYGACSARCNAVRGFLKFLGRVAQLYTLLCTMCIKLVICWTHFLP